MHHIFVVSGLHLGGRPPADHDAGFQLCPLEARRRLARFVRDFGERATAASEAGESAELVINGDLVESEVARRPRLHHDLPSIGRHVRSSPLRSQGTGDRVAEAARLRSVITDPTSRARASGAVALMLAKSGAVEEAGRMFRQKAAETGFGVRGVSDDATANWMGAAWLHIAFLFARDGRFDIGRELVAMTDRLQVSKYSTAGRGNLRFNIAVACAECGDAAGAIDLLARGAALEHDARERTSAQRRIACCLAARGRPEDAVVQMRESMRNESLLGKIRHAAMFVGCLEAAGLHAEAEAFRAEQQEAAEDAVHEDRTLSPEQAVELGIALTITGDDGQDWIDQGIKEAATDSNPYSRTMEWITAQLARNGLIDAATQAAKTMAASVEQQDGSGRDALVYQLLESWTEIGIALADRGTPKRAEEVALHLRTLEAGRFPESRLKAVSRAAVAYASAGQLDKALLLLGDARETAEAYDGYDRELLLQIVGVAFAECGRPLEARAIAEGLGNASEPFMGILGPDHKDPIAKALAAGGHLADLGRLLSSLRVVPDAPDVWMCRLGEWLAFCRQPEVPTAVEMVLEAMAVISWVRGDWSEAYVKIRDMHPRTDRYRDGPFRPPTPVTTPGRDPMDFPLARRAALT